MNIFNAVFVDCTASADIASLYEELMSKNISVVTANKIAASSSYDNYHKLKETARKTGVKFLFETNVGAGLPIINTMNSLVNSGDNILKLEAVLSGTLNFIFNTLSESIPFSKAIRMAVEAQYAEPDPRIDLSGLDVIRKLIILSREAGARVEQSDVKKHLFIDQKYFEGTLEEFWNTISEMDEYFEARRKELAKEDKKLRFVATYERGECEVGLREIEKGPSFLRFGREQQHYHDHDRTLQRISDGNQRIRGRCQRDGGRRLCRHHFHCKHSMIGGQQKNKSQQYN